MPKISDSKKKKISEQILYFLYSQFPKQVFTVEIAVELARDEEFMKRILLDMEKKGLIIKITKNPDGIDYKRRLRWRISNSAYNIYKQMQ